MTSLTRARMLTLLLLALVLILPASRAEALKPALAVGGASETEGLALSTNSTNFTRSIQIINTTKAPVDLAVELPDLIGPDSKSLKTSWQLDGKPGPTATTQIKPLQAANLDIAASLAGAGLYQSTISLIYGDARYPVALKITRSSSPPTISIVGLDSVAFEGWASERLIRFSLKETGGVSVTLRAPTLVSLTRKLGDKSVQADYSSVEFCKDKDGKLEGIGDSVVNAANESIPLFMKLKGINSPGEYTGSLAFSSNDGALPAQSFTFYIKRPWWLCALLIAFGVFISHWLRNYAKTARPRLILARRILILRQDIGKLADQLGDRQDKDLLEFFRQRLDRADDDADIGGASSVEPVLNDLNAKLSLVPLWSNLRSRIDAVQPPEDADEARSVLRPAKDFLEANKNDTEADIKAMAEQIRGAFKTIDAAIRKRLLDDIKRIQALAKAARSSLIPARQNEFDAKVDAVLTSAETVIQKSPPDVIGARRLINDARYAYAGILTNDLDEKITALTRPATLDQGEWNTLFQTFKSNVEKVRAASEGEAAVTAYEDAYAAYLNVLVRVAEETLKEVTARAVAANNTDWVEKLAKPKQSLETAHSRLRNGELNEARDSYDSARSVIDDAVKEFPPHKPMGGDRSAAQPSTLVTASTMVLMPYLKTAEFADPLDRRYYGWLQLKNIKKAVQTRDLIVSLIVGAAAIGLGIYSIWVDSPAWGGAKDIFVAVLWGLGLHQLAGNVLFAKLDLEQLEKQITGKGGGNPSVAS